MCVCVGGGGGEEERVSSISCIPGSLREIFPTDAGQEACLLSNYYLVLPEITGHLSDKLNFSAGQNENLPVLSDSPAVFAKTALEVHRRTSYIPSVYSL